VELRALEVEVLPLQAEQLAEPARSNPGSFPAFGDGRLTRSLMHRAGQLFTERVMARPGLSHAWCVRGIFLHWLA
jgi:hypothetical protein